MGATSRDGLAAGRRSPEAPRGEAFLGDGPTTDGLHLAGLIAREVRVIQQGLLGSRLGGDGGAVARLVLGVPCIAGGSFFENLVIVEAKKQLLNRGDKPNLYFWRDHVGNEVDLLVLQGGEIYPFEIKSGQTVIQGYFKGLKFWNKITNTSGGTVVYDGNLKQNRSSGYSVIPWRELRF